jgi:hypothetical protein
MSKVLLIAVHGSRYNLINTSPHGLKKTVNNICMLNTSV